MTAAAGALVSVTVPFVLRVVGFSMLGASVAFGVAALHRWYARDRVPIQFAVLAGLGAVALSLNADATLTQTVESGTAFLEPRTVAANVVVLSAATGAATAATGLGDRFTVRVGRVAGEGFEGGFGTVVRSVGRTIAVDVPDQIRDIEGYDPVDEEVKQRIAGASFEFPRGLTVRELEERFVERLRTDHGVGAVDVEFDADGAIEYIAVGSRLAGLGPTLSSDTVAVPIRADPAFTNGAGDRVQVWRDDSPERVATGELRGARDDVATVAVDEDDAADLDPETTYRLVTLPVEEHAERACAGVHRAADETVATVTVTEGGGLDGLPVGALAVDVLALDRDGTVTTIPGDDVVLAGGDRLYLMGAPQVLRRIETAAAPGATPPERDGSRR